MPWVFPRGRGGLNRHRQVFEREAARCRVAAKFGWALWPTGLNRAFEVAQEIDPRMLAQMRRFTLHSRGIAMEFEQEHEVWLRRYLIPKDNKPKFKPSFQPSVFGARTCFLILKTSLAS